jgi:hypothetical protein
MKEMRAKVIINFYGIVFIAAAVASVVLFHSKIIVGALILLIAGTALLRRKPFGVYCIFFLAFVVAGIGLLIAGLALSDILHQNYKFDMLLIGFVPVVISALTFYLFTRRELAEEFGLAKIEILEKFNKQELIVAGKVLFWIALIVGVVLLACYLVVILMTRIGFKP